MNIQELAQADKRRRKKVLHHGLEHAPLLSEQLARNHLTSGSTVQAEIVSDLVVGHRTRAAAGLAQANRQHTAADFSEAAAKLVGHSQNTHTAGHLHSVDALLHQRRDLEREAAELRNAITAAQDKTTKQGAVERLDAIASDLVETLAARQARARAMVRIGSQAALGGPDREPSESGSFVSMSRFRRRTRLSLQHNARRHSTLPAFQIAVGLQKYPVDDTARLIEAIKVRS